ncbi:hypothetical protein HYDPIDRAFT_118533, partial [Hydnomerulius pinastri MD-312]
MACRICVYHGLTNYICVGTKTRKIFKNTNNNTQRSRYNIDDFTSLKLKLPHEKSYRIPQSFIQYLHVNLPRRSSRCDTWTRLPSARDSYHRAVAAAERFLGPSLPIPQIHNIARTGSHATSAPYDKTIHTGVIAIALNKMAKIRRGPSSVACDAQKAARVDSIVKKTGMRKRAYTVLPMANRELSYDD